MTLKNWNTTEHRVSVLRFNREGKSQEIRGLDNFDLSQVSDMQSLINKAALSRMADEQLAALESPVVNAIQYRLAVHGIENSLRTYRCLGFDLPAAEQEFITVYPRTEALPHILSHHQAADALIWLLVKGYTGLLLENNQKDKRALVNELNDCFKPVIEERMLVRLVEQLEEAEGIEQKVESFIRQHHAELAERLSQGYVDHARRRRALHRSAEVPVVSSATSTSSPMNDLVSWIKEKSGTFVSTIFNEFDQGMVETSENFYGQPILESPKKQRYSENNKRLEPEYNGNMADNVYLAKWLLGRFGMRFVINRMNKSEQILANNHDSMSPIEWREKQLKIGIDTYGSEKEKATFNAFQEKRIAASPAMVFAEKSTGRKNTTSGFFRLPAPVISCQ